MLAECEGGESVLLAAWRMSGGLVCGAGEKAGGIH